MSWTVRLSRQSGHAATSRDCRLMNHNGHGGLFQLVGTGQRQRRDGSAKRFRRRQIGDETEFRRLLNPHVASRYHSDPSRQQLFTSRSFIEGDSQGSSHCRPRFGQPSTPDGRRRRLWSPSAMPDSRSSPCLCPSIAEPHGLSHFAASRRDPLFILYRRASRALGCSPTAMRQSVDRSCHAGTSRTMATAETPMPGRAPA